MFNHLIMVSSESEWPALLPSYGSADAEGAWHWRLDVVTPDQSVTLEDEVIDASDPDNVVLVSPAVRVPGYFVTVSAPDLVRELVDLPGGACRCVGNSETGAIVYAAPDLDTDLLSTARVSPVPAGAAYLFTRQ